MWSCAGIEPRRIYPATHPGRLGAQIRQCSFLQQCESGCPCVNASVCPFAHEPWGRFLAMLNGYGPRNVFLFQTSPDVYYSEWRNRSSILSVVIEGDTAYWSASKSEGNVTSIIAKGRFSLSDDKPPEEFIQCLKQTTNLA